MKKGLLSLSIIFFFSIISNAQLRVGLVAGGHQSSVNEENDIPGWDTLKGFYSGRTGVHVGFIADLPFSVKSHLFFQPGVIFYTKGRKYFQRLDTSATAHTLQVKKNEFISYIDVPLNLALKINLSKKVKFTLAGGPYISMFFNGKLKTEAIKVDTITHKLYYSLAENNDPPVGKGSDQYAVLGYGLNGHAGFEFGRVFLTADYSHGLDDFFSPASYKASAYRHQVIGATLGIFIGKPVKIDGKIKDKDKDGIADDKDNCPDEAGSAITNGCPDKDGDGVADKDDKCPDVAGLVKNNGCPVTDKDNDGVNDKDDKCPDVAGYARYGGCPIPDSDNDGINDEQDKCPQVAGFARYGGCPIPDGDNDGINDEEDKCPDQKGTAASNGCPDEIKKEIIEKVNYAAQRIQFRSEKATLLPQSLKVLDDVIKILNENPEINVMIEGHTSADGGLAFNMKLSEDRANTVRKYFESKGISESRLTAKGFGPTQPLTEGRNAAERMQNRRVELKLTN